MNERPRLLDYTDVTSPFRGADLSASPSWPMTVVEPGGLGAYKMKIHEALATMTPWTPAGWKEHVYVKILDEELKGGPFRYDVDTLIPIAISED